PFFAARLARPTFWFSSRLDRVVIVMNPASVVNVHTLLHLGRLQAGSYGERQVVGGSELARDQWLTTAGSSCRSAPARDRFGGVARVCSPAGRLLPEGCRGKCRLT